MAIVKTDRFIGMCEDGAENETIKEYNLFMDCCLELTEVLRKYNVESVELGKIYYESDTHKYCVKDCHFNFKGGKND